MTKTVFAPSISTRPVYGVLEPHQGSAHLMVADGEGGGAILDLFAKAADRGIDLKADTHLIYVKAANGTDMGDELARLGVARFYHGPSLAAAMSRIRKALGDAHMGLQIYLAGTETLIGVTQSEAMKVGFPHDGIHSEHRGSLARRVQCVHCKGITENVTTDPMVCSHCGLHLFVRDHYSRRHAAFQGVNIDAEDKGQIPAAVERFK